MENQRVVISEYGGPEKLRAITEAAPSPEPGDVRVRVLGGRGFVC